MDYAYRSIRLGQCDAAIVAATNLCLHPYVSLHFARLGTLHMKISDIHIIYDTNGRDHKYILLN
ncbi:hypothetical protein X777_04200 [Ooceraea biroi]|uniref:Beta-ketoacyl synthase-like N-terminal domain-containing protein n=1 Tax=Ooceraea biroi TaxID=2015173 RepID=A0A026VSB2_OOCBI|nr:hypothetical protein X777_04200 [Ooceraea biroi]